MSRVALLGGSPERVRQRAVAWRRCGFEVAVDADLLDLLDPDPEAALGALRRGASVLTAAPIGPRLAEAARASVGLLGVALPWAFYPPMLRLADRLDARILGKLSMARCRSYAIDRDALARELLDKAALLTRFLGPIAEVCAQVSRPEPPSATLVTLRHAGRARFSSVELTLAPGAPRDDGFELTGSAGVAWLHGGPGLLRSPAVEFHLGGRLHAQEAEADWQDAIDGCVADFALALRARRPPDLAAALHASAVTAAALASVVDGGRHVVRGDPR